MLEGAGHHPLLRHSLRGSCRDYDCVLSSGDVRVTDESSV
jgi:hypothetical protein